MNASATPHPETPGLAPQLRKAEARLRRSAYFAIREIRCELSGGLIRLVGRVPSYYLKQVAQAIVSEVLDEIVSNQIEVVSSSARQPVGGDRPAKREVADRATPARAEQVLLLHPSLHP